MKIVINGMSAKDEAADWLRITASDNMPPKPDAMVELSMTNGMDKIAFVTMSVAVTQVIDQPKSSEQ